MVAKDFGGGGLLKLSVDNTAPPFSVDSVTVDTSGSVDSQAGVAYVRGTVTCSQGPGNGLHQPLHRPAGQPLLHP